MAPNQLPNRRQMLKDAAINLVSQHGYEKTTIKEIARHCDVTVGVIYHYFKSKDDLFSEALQDYGANWEEVIPHVKELPIEDGLVFIATRLVDSWRKQKHFMKILVTESFQHENARCLFYDLLAEAREKLGQYFELKMAANEIAPGNVQIMMNIFVSHFLTAFLHKERLKIPILPDVDDEFIRSSVRMMLSGWRQGE